MTFTEAQIAKIKADHAKEITEYQQAREAAATDNHCGDVFAQMHDPDLKNQTLVLSNRIMMAAGEATEIAKWETDEDIFAYLLDQPSDKKGDGPAIKLARLSQRLETLARHALELSVLAEAE